MPWLKKRQPERGNHTIDLPDLSWVSPASTQTLEVSPGDLDTVLVTARHAGMSAVGVTASLLRKLPVQAAAWALLTIDAQYFLEVVRHSFDPDDPSEMAMTFRALSAALVGDMNEAQRRIEGADPEGHAHSLVSAMLAVHGGDHQIAGELVLEWTKSLPDSLGAPVAAAAFGFMADQKRDFAGGIYWTDLLVKMFPFDPGAGGFNVAFRTFAAEAASDNDAMLLVLVLRRQRLLERPGNQVAIDRYVKLAERIGYSQLEPLDLAIVRFLKKEASPPPGTFWEQPLACWCTTLIDAAGVVAPESLGIHLESLGRVGPITVCRCRTTNAAWVFMEKGTLKKENLARIVRLPNVAFKDLPPPEHAQVPGQYL